jgi:hypothetical protein
MMMIFSGAVIVFETNENPTLINAWIHVTREPLTIIPSEDFIGEAGASRSHTYGHPTVNLTAQPCSFFHDADPQPVMLSLWKLAIYPKSLHASRILEALNCNTTKRDQNDRDMALKCGVRDGGKVRECDD